MKRICIILIIWALSPLVSYAQSPESSDRVPQSVESQSPESQSPESQSPESQSPESQSVEPRVSEPGKKILRNEFAVTIGPRVYIGSAIYTDMIGAMIGVDYALNRLLGPIDLDFGLSGAYMMDRKNDSGNVITAISVQFPINLRYGIVLGKSRILLYAGPLVEYGISLLQQNPDGDSIDLFQGNYNRFDIMGGGGIGIVAGKHFRFTIDAHYGFLSRRKTIASAKNLQASAGLSFLF